VQPPALTAAMVAGFSLDCPGIRVNVVATDNTSLLTRFNAELKATGKPQADLLETSDTYSESVAYPGTFLPATTKLVPSLVDFPKSAIKGEAWVDFAYLWGVAYNTNTVKGSDIPKTWKDITNPKFTGKVIGADPRASTSFQSFYLYHQSVYGDSWLTALKALKQTYTATTLPATQAVAAGQDELAFPAANSHVAALKQQGAPIAITFPTPTQINAGFLGVTKGGPHPNAARVFAAFMASKTGQEIQCNASALSSENTTVGGACAGIKLPSGLTIANTTPNPADVTKMAAVLGLK
jgi:iron(III) transport system substrate-binding protein